MDAIFVNVCRNLCAEGTPVSCREIKNGNVNHTYDICCRCEDGTQQHYILQNVNTYAFRHPVEIMNNIDLVTRHIRQKKQGQVALCFCHTADGKPYWQDETGFWRMYRFLEADMFNTCEDLEVVHSAGNAFGEFQRLLCDLDVGRVFDTTPGFHDTRMRFEKLLSDMQTDPCGRVAEVMPELQYLMDVQEKACCLTDACRRGELPIRIVHNDTKINNVLFEPGTHNALAVIDLDTIMPGLAGHDFGDAIRSAANTVAEDCTDLAAVDVNMEVFRAFTDGYLSQMAATLTQAELDTLAISSFVLACELSARFLDDYIIGDPYFNIAYPKHNLDRARCQMAFSKVLFRRQPEMEAIIRDCAAGYR